MVRVTPNEISYVKTEAWNDIYKTSKGQEQLKKYIPSVSQDFQAGLFDNPNDEVHGKIRKKLSAAMSDRGIRDREPILKTYAEILVEQLKKQLAHTKEAVVDLVAWYQCYSSDVTGVMLSGEPFGSLYVLAFVCPCHQLYLLICLSANLKPNPVVESNYHELKGLAIGTALNRNLISRNLLVRTQKPPEGEHRHISTDRLQARNAKSENVNGPFEKKSATLGFFSQSLGPSKAPFKHLATDRLVAREADATDDHGDTMDILRKGQDTEAGLPRALVDRVTWDLIVAGSDTVERDQVADFVPRRDYSVQRQRPQISQCCDNRSFQAVAAGTRNDKESH